MKNIIGSIMILSFFNGCEKTVELDYKDNQSKIVIAANISNETGPYFVKITRSVKLTETGAYPVVDDAIVRMNDNAGNSETLLPQGDGIYRGNVIHGIEGRTYTMIVEADGQSYTAQSTMPHGVPFDSIKIETLVFTGEEEYNIIPVFTDPFAMGNNYRFTLSVNNRLINQHLVLNDEVRNGLVNTQRLEINNDDLTLVSGDTIHLTMQCVNQQVYTFYKTLALMADSGPGGGTTPNNPPGNISNGALGLFSAYTSQTKQVIIP